MTDAQQPPDIAQQQQQPQAPVAASPAAPASSIVGENLACQWQNCGERSPTAESLYEHVCERHVGRKSTNNLNLTCGWGACRTTTVKRDHITSHIRVHVPLKPHKCEFCGKAFKRPQDLKKHVKTHADDSVILRSPEPGSNQRPSGVYNIGNEKTPSYYAQAINPGQDHNGGYHGAPNQYYQPQHHQAAQHPAYGPVTYYSNAPATHAALSDYESRKRGFEALDNFFGEVKRRHFDPGSYQNLSHRLYELQGLQLPMITQQPVSAIPAYQPVSAMTGVGGGYGAPEPMQAYSLPPMGNIKTRGDLTSIDQILEQMQQTIYDSDTSIAQAGTGQPGAYVAYRSSNSPPSVHLSSSHLHQNSMMNQGQHQHHGSIASATESVHSSTPALTPPSSAQSYTSGHSPVSHHAMTPIQGPTSGAMYPSLPASSGGMDYGLSSTSGSGPATLMYDADDHRRRYSGGMLQRAQPAPRSRRTPNEDAMDIESEGSVTPPASAKEPKASERKASPKYSVIDPALGGDVTKTPMSESSKGGEMSKEEVERERDWVQNMRLIEWMRDYIKKRLEEGEFEDEDAATSKKVGPGDSEMSGTEQSTKPTQSLYPTLKAEV